MRRVRYHTYPFEHPTIYVLDWRELINNDEVDEESKSNDNEHIYAVDEIFSDETQQEIMQKYGDPKDINNYLIELYKSTDIEEKRYNKYSKCSQLLPVK